MSSNKSSHISQISSHPEARAKALHGDPAGWWQLILIYQKGVRRYLLIRLADQPVPEAAAEEVADAIFDKMRGGFPDYDPGRGKFRCYLIGVLRNAVKNWKRDHSRHRHSKFDPARLADSLSADDPSLIEELGDKIIEHAMQDLHNYQVRNPASLAHTLLELLQQQDEDGPSNLDYVALAERLREKTGKVLSPSALRQQVRRARKRFAKLVWREVEKHCANPTTEKVQEELCALGLWKYVRVYLGMDRQDPTE